MDISELEEGESSGIGKESLTNSPSVASKGDNIGEAGVSGAQDALEIIADDEKNWPSVVDLNTRLRRVITSYQRNINKKDDMKTPILPNNKVVQDIKQLGNHQGIPTMDSPLNVQNWDLQKLAMYLLVSSSSINELAENQLIDVCLIAMIFHRRWSVKKKWNKWSRNARGRVWKSIKPNGRGAKRMNSFELYRRMVSITIERRRSTIGLDSKVWPGSIRKVITTSPSITWRSEQCAREHVAPR